MGLSSRNLKDKVTWWQVANDGSGGFTFSAPVVLAGKWTEETQRITSGNGEEIISKSMVFLSQDVYEGDYLALGDQSAVADPGTIEEAYRIAAFRKYTDLRGVEAVRQAYL